MCIKLYYTTNIQNLTRTRIDHIRTLARAIVRDLGFMDSKLAGTALSPSAVHTVIEVGYGTVNTASGLAQMLHLEKSSVSRMLKKLQADGLIELSSDDEDRRVQRLALSAAGQQMLTEVEAFGRNLMARALDSQTETGLRKIDEGLTIFSAALKAGMDQAEPVQTVVSSGYRPGLIAKVTGLHAAYYSENYGFGAIFERKVATEMSEFAGRLDHDRNAAFTAVRGQQFLGSVSIDGEDLGGGAAHLRWFIVDPSAQGLGVGGQLLDRAIAFVDDKGFTETRLWTFKGLDAARHLYERYGFELIEERSGWQWGTEVSEQTFVRKLPH